jgi:hypothetical protein
MLCVVDSLEPDPSSWDKILQFFNLRDIPKKVCPTTTETSLVGFYHFNSYFASIYPSSWFKVVKVFRLPVYYDIV